jgi:HPt (histidine-containing phosphotransfer) domain-containing protein
MCIRDRFCDALPNDMNELSNAVERRDVKEIELITHRIKGTVKNMSANCLKKSLFEIEEVIKSHDLDKLDTLLMGLKGQSSLLCAAVMSRLK